MPFCLVHSRRLCLEKRLINSLVSKYTKYTIDHPHFQVNTVTDPGKGPGVYGPPLFFDQNEARRGGKNFLGDRPPPPSYLQVCKSMVYCSHLSNLVSAQVGYEELAGVFKPIRNGEMF